MATLATGSTSPLPHSVYKLRPADEAWAHTLAQRRHDAGEVVYFAQTSLELQRAGATLTGLVYQRVDKPDQYYVVEGDVMFDLERGDLYSPGSCGSSTHAPQTRKFIACLECQSGGVPFLVHPRITRGSLWWFADPKFSRFE